MTTLCLANSATGFAQAGLGLAEQHSFNAGGDVQIGPAGGWVLFSVIGEPVASDPMNSTSGDITWVGFPTILPKGVPSGVREEHFARPESSSKIKSVTPNPLVREGTITFTLAHRSHVRLFVVDVLGREHDLLVNGEREEGLMNVHWHPEMLDAGTYFLRLSIDGVEESSMMIQYYR